MENSIPDFINLYRQRPIEHNHGGMGFNHSWATWFASRELQPNLIAESGVFRGHSTWILEHAAPKAQMYSFDINLGNLEYVSDKAEYFEGDIRQFDWSDVDVTDTGLAFIDDHQNSLQRVMDLFFFGFKRFLIEDNYPVGEGDCYSLKHMQAAVGFTSQQNSHKIKASMNSNQLQALEQSDLLLSKLGNGQRVLVEPNFSDWKNLMNRTRLIQTFPPVKLDTVNRWGQSHSGNYETLEPLGFPAELFSESTDWNFDYTWITYLELL